MTPRAAVLASPADTGGQATPLVAVVLLFAGMVLVGLAHLGHLALDAARADTAADAAALAGVVHGPGAAARLARADGAVLVAFERLDDDVTVTVRVGSATSTARAHLEPG